MNLPLKISAFLIANILGYFAMPFCYFLGVRLGEIPLSDPNFNPAALHRIMAVGTMTWVICGLFSLAFFFLKGREKYFFLAAPVLFPLGYGLNVLLDLL